MPAARRLPGQHPLVAAAQGTPAAPPDSPVTVTGFFGNSPQSGKHRVYFTPQLDHYAEFSDSDIMHTEDNVPADSLGAPGQTATRVTLQRGAKIEFTRVQKSSISADNQFDLDLQLGGGGAGGGPAPVVATLNCTGSVIRTMCIAEPPPVRATFGCNTTGDCARTMYTWNCTWGCGS